MFTDLTTFSADDFVAGEKFTAMADYVYRYYDYTASISPPCNARLLYSDLSAASALMDRLPASPVVLLFHNGDESFDDKLLARLPHNVKSVWAQNVVVNDERVFSLPIGVENERWFPSVHKRKLLLEKAKYDVAPTRMAYLNINVNTNVNKRLPVLKLLQATTWCTTKQGLNGVRFAEYVDDILDHFFVVCPEGNGVDCHRTWETLLLNRVPVVLRRNNDKMYHGLPVLLIDSWEQLTERFLLSQRDLFARQPYSVDKLRFNYWRAAIMRDVNTCCNKE